MSGHWLDKIYLVIRLTPKIYDIFIDFLLILVFVIKRIPVLAFSLKRMKSLLQYGYKILLTNLMFTFVDQLRTIIIGKFYSPADLAYYDKGKHFPSLLSTNITTPIGSILFPTLSVVQDSIESVKNIMRKSMQTITFVIPPFMVGLAVTSEVFVKILLTEKWLSCVPFIWISCIYYIFVPTHTVNLEAVKAIGKSAVLASFINGYQNKRLFNYSYKEQFADIIPNLIGSVIMGAIVYFVGNIGAFNNYITLIIQVLLGVITYIGIALITKNKSFYYCVDLIKQFKNRSV